MYSSDLDEAQYREISQSLIAEFDIGFTGEPPAQFAPFDNPQKHAYGLYDERRITIGHYIFGTLSLKKPHPEAYRLDMSQTFRCR